MTHRDRMRGPSGRREVSGDVAHRQDFPTPSEGPHMRSLWVIISAPWYEQ